MSLPLAVLADLASRAISPSSFGRIVLRQPAELVPTPIGLSSDIHWTPIAKKEITAPSSSNHPINLSQRRDAQRQARSYHLLTSSSLWKLWQSSAHTLSTARSSSSSPLDPKQRRSSSMVWVGRPLEQRRCGGTPSMTNETSVAAWDGCAAFKTHCLRVVGGENGCECSSCVSSWREPEAPRSARGGDSSALK